MIGRQGFGRDEQFVGSLCCKTYKCTVPTVKCRVPTVKCTVPTVKPLSLYKCSECSFGTTTPGELKDHKKEKHEKATENVLGDAVFFHSCISCDYKTNDYVKLMKHIDSTHGNKPSTRTMKNPIGLKFREKMILLKSRI